jgi:uncharacterized protein (UPF0147 family)
MNSNHRLPLLEKKLSQSARYLQQSLDLMEDVKHDHSTPEEVREKIETIISAFEIDKNELNTILGVYF